VSDLPNGIFKRWIHSFEEDSEDGAVYRPPDFDFPLARGRKGLELKEDSEFIEYTIGRTDAPHGNPGRWQPEGANRVRVTFTDERISPRTLEILYCDGKILKLRK